MSRGRDRSRGPTATLYWKRHGPSRYTGRDGHSGRPVKSPKTFSEREPTWHVTRGRSDHVEHWNRHLGGRTSVLLSSPTPTTRSPRRRTDPDGHGPTVGRALLWERNRVTRDTDQDTGLRCASGPTESLFHFYFTLYRECRDRARVEGSPFVTLVKEPQKGL